MGLGVNGVYVVDTYRCVGADGRVMIEVKDIKVLSALLKVPYHPALDDILLWIYKREGKLLFTDGFRPGDPGCHGTNPCRAVDLRSWIFDNPETVCAMINNYWVYDPERPFKNVCKYHNVGNGWHFHIQVHPNTKRRIL